MQKLKFIIRKVINRDLLDICNKPDPSAQQFSVVIHSYQSLTADKKIHFTQNLQRKLSRPHQNVQTLNLLILCDFLSGTNPQIFQTFPKSMLQNLDKKRKIRSMTKQQKIVLAENNYIYFYLEYLREKIWSHSKNIDNLAINTLEDGITYCQSAINALKLIIRHDFIIDYVLTYSQLKNQIRISVQNMLRRSSEDLALLIKFVDKWNYIIVQNRPQSIMVNQIYQQLIYISKNIAKFQHLNNKIKSSQNTIKNTNTNTNTNTNIKFPKYEINKNLNVTIEKSMIGRENQRRSFYSQKRLKTDGDFCQEQSEITESQIYMGVRL